MIKIIFLYFEKKYNYGEKRRMKIKKRHFLKLKKTLIVHF